MAWHERNIALPSQTDTNKYTHINIGMKRATIFASLNLKDTVLNEDMKPHLRPHLLYTWGQDDSKPRIQ